MVSYGDDVDADGDGGPGGVALSVIVVYFTNWVAVAGDVIAV